MYSKNMVTRARNLKVLEIKRKFKGKIRRFKVISSIKETREIRFDPSKPMQKAFTCPCYHFANVTIHTQKFCTEILSIIGQKLRYEYPKFSDYWQDVLRDVEL